VRPSGVRGLTVKTPADNSAVSTVVFIAPARRSMTYNITVTCDGIDGEDFRLVSRVPPKVVQFLLSIANKLINKLCAS